jgi:RNA methyltransferase, TrmH family
MKVLKIDDLKKLHQKKYRQEFGCFLAEGEHLVQELQNAAADNPALMDSILYVTEKYQDWPAELATVPVSDRVMAQLSDTPSPQGILACVPIDALQNKPFAADKAERAIYLHEIQDPGNLGTILRTLAWFGGFRCMLSQGSVDPFNSKVVRSSMGAIFHVPLELDVPVEVLTSRYADIACLDMNGGSIKSAAFHHAACLAFGNEARGLPEQIKARDNALIFSIPGAGKIESLNLATTVNLCVYELCR